MYCEIPEFYCISFFFPSPPKKKSDPPLCLVSLFSVASTSAYMGSINFFCWPMILKRFHT